MNYSSSLRLAAVCGSALVSACAADAPKGPHVTVTAAPLSYPGVSDVCYGLTVFNGPPGALGTDTVWSKDGVCSGTYGNSGGGDISYVGTCDAGVDGDNYVALTLETIRVAGGGTLLDQVSAANISGADADFENPCTADDRCVLHFECKENADVAVTFNLTVMRDAQQGFFDIAVNFEDVFCSAKVDSCYALGAPIEQLFGDDIHDGPGRDLTTVAAVACTAGQDLPGHGFDTNLLFTTKTVSCDGGVSFTLDPVGEQGGNLTCTSNDGDYTLRYAHYYGAEELACGAMQRTDGNGDLYFDCGDETCRISGFAPPNGLGYGSGAAAAASAAAAAGGYGGYGLNAAQGSQGSYGAGAGAAAAGLGYGGYAAAAGVTLHYFVGDTEIFPELDGNNEPILDGWVAIYDPLSCNKTFYNTAIDVENLIGQGLSGCTLSFHATALASDDTTTGFDPASGTFARQGGLYGAIQAAQVPLIDGNGNATCNTNPLDGVDLYGNPSHVKTQYIGTLADTNPAFCFHSDNGNPLDQLSGCTTTIPTDCPYNCGACEPWGNAVSLTCVPQGLGGMICSGTGANPNTTLTLFGLGGGYGDPTIGTFDSDANGNFVSERFPGDAWQSYVVSQGGEVLVSTGLMCTECYPDHALNELGYCSYIQPPLCEVDHCAYCPNVTTCDQCQFGYVRDENGQCIQIPLCDEAAHCQVCGTWGDLSLDCETDIEGTFRCELKGGPADTAVILYSTNGYETQYATTDGGGSASFIVSDGANVDGEFLYIVDETFGEILVTTNPLNCQTCAPGYFRNNAGMCIQGGGGA